MAGDKEARFPCLGCLLQSNGQKKPFGRITSAQCCVLVLVDLVKKVVLEEMRFVHDLVVTGKKCPSAVMAGPGLS